MNSKLCLERKKIYASYRNTILKTYYYTENARNNSKPGNNKRHTLG